jgi:hypothetical protein
LPGFILSTTKFPLLSVIVPFIGFFSSLKKREMVAYSRGRIDKESKSLPFILKPEFVLLVVIFWANIEEHIINKNAAAQ